MIGDNRFLFDSEPTSIDAGVYGFVANIYFYKIDTPLRKFFASRANFIRHCNAVHTHVVKELKSRITFTYKVSDAKIAACSFWIAPSF